MCRKNLCLSFLLMGLGSGLLTGCLLGNGFSLVLGLIALVLGCLLAKKY